MQIPVPFLSHEWIHLLVQMDPPNITNGPTLFHKKTHPISRLDPPNFKNRPNNLHKWTHLVSQMDPPNFMVAAIFLAHASASACNVASYVIGGVSLCRARFALWAFRQLSFSSRILMSPSGIEKVGLKMNSCGRGCFSQVDQVVFIG